MDGSWNIGSIGIAGPPLRGPSSSRLVAEPPLSPPVSGSSPVASAQPVEPSHPLQPAGLPAPQSQPAAPAPAGEPAPKPAASLESLLMRFRLITSDQLDEALREKAGTGNDVGAIVVARGWVNEDQLARLLSYAPAFPAEAASSPPTSHEPEPEPEPEPQPEPALDAQPEAAPALEQATSAEPADQAEPVVEPAAPTMGWPEIPPALELVDEPSSGFAPAPVEITPEAPAALEPETHEEPEHEATALAEPVPAAEPASTPEPDPEPFAEPTTPPEAPEAAPAPVALEPLPEPAPQLEPEPVAIEPMPEPQLEPALEPAPEPEPATAAEQQVVRFVEPASIETIARVFVRLSNGERVEAGSFDDMAAAKARAEEVVAEVSNGANGWPFFAGRYIRPEAIVSVDLDATVVRYA